jgi:hypothetical protein
MNLFRDLFFASLPPFAVVVLQALRVFLLPDAIQLDMVAHFLGGVAIAWSATIIWIRWRKRKLIPAKIPTWMAAWCIFGAVLFASVAWELWEFAMQYYTDWMFQLSLADTMGDFVMDSLGGTMLILVAWKKYR